MQCLLVCWENFQVIKRCQHNPVLESQLLEYTPGRGVDHLGSLQEELDHRRQVHLLPCGLDVEVHILPLVDIILHLLSQVLLPKQLHNKVLNPLVHSFPIFRRLLISILCLLLPKMLKRWRIMLQLLRGSSW